MTSHIDLHQVVRDSVASLSSRFPDRPSADIEAAVREELAKLVDRPVQDYLSVLTERAVRDRFKREAGVVSTQS